MDIIIRKLELRSPLSGEEKSVLRDTFATVRVFEARRDLVAEGEKPAFVGALLDGLLARHKTLPDGHRQILSFPLPGDIFDLHSFLLERMDHSIGAISRCIVSLAPHSAVQELALSHPRLGNLLCRDAVIEAAIFREWIVNCGRRTAYQRIAHLFCEIFSRMSDVGLTSRGGCTLPLTQAELGEATGLSVVHVNRTVQQLRGKDLVRLDRGRLTILDWDGLAAAGGFKASYLHGGATPAHGGFPIGQPTGFVAAV